MYFITYVNNDDFNNRKNKLITEQMYNGNKWKSYTKPFE